LPANTSPVGWNQLASVAGIRAPEFVASSECSIRNSMMPLRICEPILPCLSIWGLFADQLTAPAVENGDVRLIVETRASMSSDAQ
jgi:hypothetical protein